TQNSKGIGSATEIARLIREEIRSKTRLTASAGVSYNKFLAKAASDFRKPDGLTVVTPGKARAFIDGLPIGKFFGVGKVTEQRMRSLGIETGADLRRFPQDELIRLFGKAGSFFHGIAHGIDERPVVRARIRKSLGREVTLEEDIDDVELMLSILTMLAQDVGEMLRERRLRGKTVTLKLKFSDFQGITRSITLEDMLDQADEIARQAAYLLKETEAGSRKVRLLGITVSNFESPRDKPGKGSQLILPIFE
ncbi:MAG TPA: DNA polymerase IV, partial [Deltaproteobacteria bacterium]|nr:DNA polymerase IV [Deltaproteobacteria bacterium]